MGAAATRRQRRHIRRGLVAVSLVLLLATARAQAREWQPVGPPGGQIAALAVDPRRPDTVYAGMSRKGGLYRSTDGGEHWVLLAFPTASVSWIGFHPTDDAVLFAVCVDGLMRSPDRGATWTVAGPNSGTAGLEFDPGDPAVMYVATPGRVFRTTEGARSGRMWSAAGGALPFDDPVLALFTLPRQPDALYVLTGTHGLFESLDRGESWHGVAEAPQSARGGAAILTAAAVGSTTPPIVYAAMSGAPDAPPVVKSTDAGLHWEPTGTGLPDRPMTLAIAPGDANTVYATLGLGRFFATRDGGAHWVDADAGLPTSLAGIAAVDPHHPATVYVGTYGGGVWKTDDGGAAWRGVSTGIDAALVHTLVLAPWPRPALFALTFGGGPFASANGGRTWRSILAGLPRSSSDAVAIAPDPTRPGTVYIGTHTGLYVSTDTGATWQPESPSDLTGGIVAVALDPAPPRTLYVGCESGALLRRQGDGPWVTIHPARPRQDIVDVATWYPETIVVDRARPATLYWERARTRDGGGTWTDLAPLPSGALWKLVADPAPAPGLYAGGSRGDVVRSTDGGATWQPAGPGLPSATVDALIVDPRHPATLYAASGGRVFVSADRGAHWRPFDAAALGVPIASLAVDAGALYVATEGRGVLKMPMAPSSP